MNLGIEGAHGFERPRTRIAHDGFRPLPPLLGNSPSVGAAPLPPAGSGQLGGGNVTPQQSHQAGVRRSPGRIAGGWFLAGRRESRGRLPEKQRGQNRQAHGQAGKAQAARQRDHAARFLDAQMLLVENDVPVGPDGRGHQPQALARCGRAIIECRAIRYQHHAALAERLLDCGEPAAGSVDHAPALGRGKIKARLVFLGVAQRQGNMPERIQRFGVDFFGALGQVERHHDAIAPAGELFHRLVSIVSRSPPMSVRVDAE